MSPGLRHQVPVAIRNGVLGWWGVDILDLYQDFDLTLLSGDHVETKRPQIKVFEAQFLMTHHILPQTAKKTAGAVKLTA